jgi:hypothetical protein
MRVVKNGSYFYMKLQITVLLILLSCTAGAQYKNLWMSAGSLHNWYSAIGSEIEEGWVLEQQYGMQWPAIHPHQDMQAARGMWIGAKNFVDQTGTSFPYKVVTAGPRNPQFYALYPTKFEMTSKFEPTLVSVDGIPSFQKDVSIDDIDETMIWDRMIENVCNTQLGLTMTRKIFQFSQQFHDNYIVYEYTFTNTGNVDADDEIELPSQTLNDVYFFWTYRNAPNAQTRFVIGNSTGWGKNTMNDARGDGVELDPPEENFRAQFSWHGFTSEKTVSYDNIGGPVFEINSDAQPYFPDKSDTVGRLAGTQFLGLLTLHADVSTTNPTDDPTQPSTTSYENSDYDLFLGGRDNAFNIDRMTQQYLYMAKGHQSPRHAKLVEPSGDYAIQTTNPNLGNTGGFSFNNGYGPYTIGPGESIKLVMIEAAAGMNYEDQVRFGSMFKQGTLTAELKNREVMKSKDSLFQTFRRAIENFESGWNIPQPPFPPEIFDVTGGGDRITLAWTPRSGDPNPPVKYHIYRAEKNVDSTYRLIHVANPGETGFDDVTPIRGVDYYYYIVGIGPSQPGGPGTPAGSLESGRYYTQTYDPVRLKRPAGERLSDIRVVPNPYSISASDNLRFPGDRIAFYNIPGQCTIKIYSELGELIKTIEHTNGSGDEFWESVTSSNQIVVSGIYIVVITDNTTGEKHITKFAVVR